MSSITTEGLSKLESFPTELLEKIFLNLDERDVASCRGVSRTFKDVVEGSLQLQYRIACFLARVVDNPLRKDVDLRERLDKVLGWSKAFDTCQWTGNSQVIISDPVLDAEEGEDGGILDAPICRAFGTAYVLQAGRCITVIQPRSVYKGRTEEKWVIHDCGFFPRGFAYDPYRKVLALVEKMDEQHYRVNLTTPSGEAHAMVPVPYFLVLVSEDGMPDVKPLFNVLLYSDFLLVDMDRPDERGDHEVWIFNWKTGILLVNLHGYIDHYAAPRGVAFLDSEHILVPIVNPWIYNDLEPNRIAILDIYPPQSVRRSILEVAQGAKLFLSLPQPSEGNEYWKILAFGPPPPSPKDATALEEIFTCCQDTSLIYILIEMMTPTSSSDGAVSMLVHREFIQSLLVEKASQSTIRGAPNVLWDDWAPHTRIFRRQIEFSRIPRHPPLFGTRLFTGPLSPDNLDAGVLDFIDKKRHKIFEDAFTQPATLFDPKSWACPLRSGSELSYRRSQADVRSLLQSPGDILLAGEGFIIVERAPDLSLENGETIIDTYWI